MARPDSIEWPITLSCNTQHKQQVTTRFALQVYEQLLNITSLSYNIYYCWRSIRDVTLRQTMGMTMCLVLMTFLFNTSKTYCMFICLTPSFVFRITECSTHVIWTAWAHLTLPCSPNQSACATGCVNTSVHYRCETTKRANSFMCVRKLYSIYRGPDNSLARPGRKQATATEDFDVHISYL